MKVFLSSTFVDLGKARAEVSAWLTGVFGAELIVMETFGSDTTPPDITSIRRVRECDAFIGIYARRYGTVDQNSGKSITELELEEAKNALSTGVLKTILLYVLKRESPWPQEFTEKDEAVQIKLERLAEKARHHTCTLFERVEQLPFFIVRDVYREISARAQHVRKLRDFSLPPVRPITQPLGMEFLTSADRGYLAGRQKQVDDLIALLRDNQICLLLGDSGVGKTSLIHAGLIPNLPASWRTVYSRPFGLPESDVTNQIQTSIFDGLPSYKGPLPPLLAEVLAALGDKSLLLIIDQFEDVLAARDNRELEQLIEDIRSIREIYSPSVRLLICYRADLEARLGELWQRITGSAQGLPRLYLPGIDEHSAWDVIKKVLGDLSVEMTLGAEEETAIEQDLVTASHGATGNRVYPPYVQILIDHIWSTSKQGPDRYSLKDYTAAGSIEGIVGTYLSRLISYAQDSKGTIQAVLVALVRSHGSKKQVTLQDIAGETARDFVQCEAAVERLIDLRLVRHIGEYYEISHDFIARKVLYELVDADELAFKRFRELLSSKSAAFSTTRSLLTTEELLMLYIYRDRILPNELELRLLLASWLSNEGPALYWILKADPDQLPLWLQAEQGFLDDQKSTALAALLKRKLKGQALTGQDYSVFHGYQLSTELAALIREAGAIVPEKVLRYGLRHRRAEVRNASLEAAVREVKNGDWSWIQRLRGSSSNALRRTYENLACDSRVPVPPVNAGDRALQEFAIIKQIALDPVSAGKHLLENLRMLRPSRSKLLFGRALYLVRTGRVPTFLSKAGKMSAADCVIWFSAIRPGLSDQAFELLIQKYEQWNSNGGEARQTQMTKSNALARAICRLADEQRVNRIVAVLRKTPLLWSSRPLVAALLRYGGNEELAFLLERIAGAKYHVDYWNHTELGSITQARMSQIGVGIPPFLETIANTTEFWSHVRGQHRRDSSKEMLLPIVNPQNRPLFIRLAGYGLLGAAKKEDQELLLRLSTHEYGLIARAAAKRLVCFFGSEVFKLLSAGIEESIRSNRTDSISEALVAAELEAYGIMPELPAPLTRETC